MLIKKQDNNAERNDEMNDEMNVNDLIFGINKQLDENELIPVLDIIEKLSIDEEKIRAFCDYYKIDIQHIYYVEGGSSSFFYYNFPLYTSIINFDISEEDSLFNITKHNQFVKEVFEKQDWTTYIYATNGHCSTLIFKQIYPSLPKKDKYTFLKEFYVQQFHGHTMISKEMWREALENRGDDYKIELPFDKEVYTIYRGQGSKSASIENTISWSLDSTTAINFAKRDINNAIIVEAKVKKESIIDYIDDRNEDEVLVLPSDVFDVKQYIQYSPSELFQELVDKKVILETNYYKNSFLKKEYFLDDTPGHGLLHSKRVLFLSMTLAYLEGLKLNERAILANAAMYHDIGRTNDDVDDEHGRISREQVELNEISFYTIDCQNQTHEDDYSLGYLSPRDVDITERIIENHSLSDKVGLSDEAIIGLSSDEAKSYKKLYQLFKDADALDRLRFSDLNFNYLRSDQAKKLLTYAMTILRQIK